MGFSADFHRKLLDIVKQHLDNAEILADVLAALSRQTLVNISLTVFEIENWELKNGVLAVQKVAETGNIEKKVLWQMVSIMLDTSACRRLSIDSSVSEHLYSHW